MQNSRVMGCFFSGYEGYVSISFFMKFCGLRMDYALGPDKDYKTQNLMIYFVSSRKKSRLSTLCNVGWTNHNACCSL